MNFEESELKKEVWSNPGDAAEYLHISIGPDN